jgi:hypothetical protein
MKPIERTQISGGFDVPCPTCKPQLEENPKAKGLLPVCPYCGYVLKAGSWVVNAPDGEFADWFYKFQIERKK